MHEYKVPKNLKTKASDAGKKVATRDGSHAEAARVEAHPHAPYRCPPINADISTLPPSPSKTRKKANMKFEILANKEARHGRQTTHTDVHQLNVAARIFLSSYKMEIGVPARTAAQARRQSGEHGPQEMHRSIYVDAHVCRHPPWSPPILSAGSKSPREALFPMDGLMS